MSPLKNCNFKWIIGCLSAIIVLLISFISLKEFNIINFSFTDCFSFASTVTSIILSVVAMIYTFYSARDNNTVNAMIQSTIQRMDVQINKIDEEIRENSNLLREVSDISINMRDLLNTSNTFKNSVENSKIDSVEKKKLITEIENSQQSMLSFLDKMNGRM